MSQSRDLPLSSFAPPVLMLEPGDYLTVLRECDRLLAKIKQLRADWEAKHGPILPRSDANFVKASLELALKPESEIPPP